MNIFLKFLKDWTLPLAMVTGVVFYRFFDATSFLIPYLIFGMLLLTFSKLTPRKVRLSRMHLWLVLIQLTGSAVVYLTLFHYNRLLAESSLICFLAPTATSAAVVTGMLGGSVSSLTSYTLISNLMVAVAAPLVFSIIGTHGDPTFLGAFLYIGKKVTPLLILPLILAWTIQQFLPEWNRKITKFHFLTFYIWAFALMIVTGKTVSFLFNQKNPDAFTEILMGAVSLIICLFQFLVGRAIGKHNKKTIAGGQALMQKNTILAIWMAQTFLHPVSSVGPAAYVLWQNSLNSWQLWRRRKRNHTRNNLQE